MRHYRYATPAARDARAERRMERAAELGPCTEPRDDARQLGLTTRVMGLRASESRNRRMSIGMRGLDYRYTDGSRALLPIGIWQTDDVWAYIVEALPRRGRPGGRRSRPRCR